MPAVSTTVPLFKYKWYGLLELEFSLIRQQAEFSVWAHLHRILPTIKRKRKTQHHSTQQPASALCDKTVAGDCYDQGNLVAFLFPPDHVLCQTQNEHVQQLLLSCVEISNQKIKKMIKPAFHLRDLPTFRLWLQQLLFVILHRIKSNIFTLFSRTDYY